MLGARLLGADSRRHVLMRALTLRLLALGVVTGVCAAVAMGSLRPQLAGLFTRDAHVKALLYTAWPLLCALQPINAAVFVYDGLLYATRSFGFVMKALAVGALGVFAPALAAALVWGGGSTVG